MEDIVVLFIHFILSSISTFGFALFMQVPKKHVLYPAIIGGFGWISYLIFTEMHLGAVMSSFFAACVVGFFGETFARTLKAPSIIFVIPGMLPLVPGRGLYFTMEELIKRNYFEAISHGTTTIAIAGAISLGIILVTSFARALFGRNYNVHKSLLSTEQNKLEKSK